MEISERARRIAEILDDKKAQDIVILRVADMTIISDYFVVASAPNVSHVQTLSEEVQLKIRDEQGASPLRTEGERQGRWVVIDYGDVLVHIFHKEEREFYQLERLWKTEGNFCDYSAEQEN
ncbi:MAG: ribosome silencing factor [Christensenella sp.]|uniref:ribosome silencing factor n=1 Tax=Christensenella sp. TaxID=1935934 RepID=UPI002B206DB2|nr:ribosome silencing factor [Christensenella sp.]MEA5002445.1 ribosome silencing factor [Christensenella sp.]